MISYFILGWPFLLYVLLNDCALVLEIYFIGPWYFSKTRYYRWSYLRLLAFLFAASDLFIRANRLLMAVGRECVGSRYGAGGVQVLVEEGTYFPRTCDMSLRRLGRWVPVMRGERG